LYPKCSATLRELPAMAILSRSEDRVSSDYGISLLSILRSDPSVLADAKFEGNIDFASVLTPHFRERFVLLCPRDAAASRRNSGNDGVRFEEIMTMISG
jgi:hypothetical protein